MANILLLLLLQTQVTGSQATGALAGRVRSNSGHALGGAVVSIWTTFYQARADSLGHYTMDSIPAGVVQVTVWAYRYQTLHQDVMIKAGRTDTTDFVLLPMPTEVMPARSVYGIVRDADTGHPVAWALVSVSGIPGDEATDSLGRYHIDSVPTGTVQLQVRRLGYHVVRMSTTMTVGPPLQVDFTLHDAHEGVLIQR
ncbi:MAG TPA: carboxypeptidase-like regulatory domain-containing protein [Gemmatimonadaceae bacterium]|nr:carboxypeptidase-like regulatory domain-containing protein [Gemmatimonadaceae bacterium]